MTKGSPQGHKNICRAKSAALRPTENFPWVNFCFLIHTASQREAINVIALELAVLTLCSEVQAESNLTPGKQGLHALNMSQTRTK